MQRAKFIMDIATEQVADTTPKVINAGKDWEMQQKKRKAGIAGGKARAESLSAKKRKEIAKKANKVRWHKDN